MRTSYRFVDAHDRDVDRLAPFEDQTARVVSVACLPDNSPGGEDELRITMELTPVVEPGEPEPEPEPRTVLGVVDASEAIPPGEPVLAAARKVVELDTIAAGAGAGVDSNESQADGALAVWAELMQLPDDPARALRLARSYATSVDPAR